MNTRPAAKGRRAGKETSARILRTARQLLMNEGYAQFSMRNVAASADMHLANVQYYFPTREDLVRALLDDTSAYYIATFNELRARTPGDPVARFSSIIEFSLKDVATWETRRFFIQLWALLSTLDGTSGSLMNEMYAVDIHHLSECIAELVGGLEKSEVRRRATTLAAMIEGMVVVRSAHSRSPRELKRLLTYAQATALHIARGLPTAAE